MLWLVRLCVVKFRDWHTYWINSARVELFTQWFRPCYHNFVCLLIDSVTPSSCVVWVTITPGSVSAIKNGYPSKFWELKTTPFSRGFLFLEILIPFHSKTDGSQALKWPRIWLMFRDKSRGISTHIFLGIFSTGY